MKIVCISDTHNKHRLLEIPKGDVLIHAGDFSEGGTKREIADFFDWFSSMSHPHKICVAGNHDFFLDGISLKILNELLPSNVHYLMEKGIYIQGLFFWGSPFSPISSSWAFSQKKKILKHSWDKIPDKTDVLITHTPPFAILDEDNFGKPLGDSPLLKRINEVKPKLHIFGHLHDNYGIVKSKRTTFVNATNFNSAYALINPPVEISLD